MAFTGLTSPGLLMYNGYVFDKSSDIKVSTQRVRDRANRTVIYSKHTITVHTFVTGTPSDYSVQQIRRALERDGAMFVFFNKGWGLDLWVNTGLPADRDVKWGPKSDVLSWDAIGSNRTCEINWSVTVCVPDCEQSRRTGVMALNYSINNDYDLRGDLTRTISGYIEIALTRETSGNAVVIGTDDTADNYRKWMAVQPPLGFERTQSWNLGDDKSRINFRIQDRQISSRNPYPANIINMDGDHTVTWSRGGRQGGTFRNRMSMTIDPRRGLPPETCYKIFASYVNHRVNYARYEGENPKLAYEEAYANEKVKATAVLLDNISISEDLFGFPVRFSASWRTMGTLAHILDQTGLFLPYYNTDKGIKTNWKIWQQSMIDTQLNPYGNTENQILVHDPLHEAVINLCGSGLPQLVPAYQPQDQEETEDKPEQWLTNQKPKPEESWLKYFMRTKIHKKRPVSQAQVIQDPDIEIGADEGSGADIDDVNKRNNPDTTYFPAAQDETADVVQVGGRSTYQVELSGVIERVAFPIPLPALKTIGSAASVTEIGTKFASEIVGNYLGQPVRRLMFKTLYAIPTSPGRIYPALNLAEGIVGSGVGIVTAEDP